MLMNILSLQNADLSNKTVFLRCDINSPVDPRDLSILDKSRLIEVANTIRKLNNCKLVVASHQGRLGNSDYISMSQHAIVLSELLNRVVKFVPDISGPIVITEIQNMNNGDILLLDNLRFLAEENSEMLPEQAVNSHLVKKLSPYFDVCVLDAFSTSHRSHPSIVGFAELMPAYAGTIVEGEVKALQNIVQNPDIKFTAILGGAKIPDRLKSIQKLINAGRIEKTLLGGLIGNAFLTASDQVPLSSTLIDDKNSVQTAKSLLEQYPDKFVLAEDVAVEVDGKRTEKKLVDVNASDKIFDIGTITIQNFLQQIDHAENIFITGPLGMFENQEFRLGTVEILNKLANSNAKTITSGGHLSAVLEQLQLKDKIYHVSTAGGALVRYLTGEELPLLQALNNSAARYNQNQ